jgi:hypothetical protein
VLRGGGKPGGGANKAKRSRGDAEGGGSSWGNGIGAAGWPGGACCPYLRFVLYKENFDTQVGRALQGEL